MIVKPGDIYTKNGFDFHVQFVENDTAFGVKYYSEEREVQNFMDCKKGYWPYRVPIADLLAYEAEVIRK